jgi:YidC/Oxa1 family membrane protein insertase
MDNLRLVLFFALALILMMIWQAWERQNAPAPASPAATSAAPSLGADQDVPRPPAAAPAMSATPAPETAEHGARIQVHTDLLQAVIDTQGGDLRELDLLAYPVSVDQPHVPFPLMRDSGPELFVAQSGLIGVDPSCKAATDCFPTHKVRFDTARTQYALADKQDELRVPLTWKSPDGVRYTKTYVFHRGSYVIDVEFNLTNTTRQAWTGYIYGQFRRTHAEQHGFFSSRPSYVGGALYTPTSKYEKVPFSEMAKKPLKLDTTGGWVAMSQHYFVGSWFPAAGRDEFYTDVQGDQNIIGYKSLDPVHLASGASATLRSSLFAGPKEEKILKTLPTGMDLTVDYGWLTVIATPLFWLLKAIHSFVGNWGWAIILLTIIVKGAFYPLSAASYKSMAQMKKMQPKIQAIKDRHPDDKQKQQQAMMELYKTEKINPLGGCLPIVIQIPVFIALYWVLLESIEMRQAPWILWIHDLSIKDPYYVLPIIMGVSMYAQQLLNPQAADPMQRKIFMLMPLFFTAMFLFFPAGLVLYWTVNNLLSLAQQWRINTVIAAKAK